MIFVARGFFVTVDKWGCFRIDVCAACPAPRPGGVDLRCTSFRFLAPALPPGEGSSLVCGVGGVSEPPPWLSSGTDRLPNLPCNASEKAIAVEERTVNMANAIMSRDTERRSSRSLAAATMRDDEPDERSLSTLLSLLELLSVLPLCIPSDDS